MNADNPNPPPRRRWPQFRLRTLLVLTALVAALCGWLSFERLQSAREVAIAEGLAHKSGVTLVLAGPFDRAEPVYERQPMPSRWQKWARWLLGDRVIAVHRRACGQPGSAHPADEFAAAGSAPAVEQPERSRSAGGPGELAPLDCGRGQRSSYRRWPR